MSGMELVGECVPTRRSHDERLRREVAGRLTRIVVSSPGISATEAVERVRLDVPVQAAFTFSVLGDLTHEGRIHRRTWGFRHCLFASGEGLEDWWQQVAAMRDEALCILYDTIRERPWTLAEICREIHERHGWAKSTTKARIQRLQETGLVNSPEQDAETARSAFDLSIP